MGKSRVKGIVVEIGGDTVGLDKALDGTYKKISSTQTSLKDVERLLKFDPKNTVLLEQKQKLLADVISETESKLEALNNANDQMKDSVNNYDAWKAAYDPIKEQIDTTKKKLKELKAQQAEMKDCGEVDTDAYKQLQAEIEDTSKELRDLKKQAKEVSDEFGNPISTDKYYSLQREIEDSKQRLRKLADEAEDTEKKLNGIDEKPLDDVADSAKKAADALDNASDKASTFGDVLKAEAIVEGAKGIVVGLQSAAEETKEYRKIMGSLEVSSEAAGYSAEQTQEAYKELYGVLADDQSAATTVANLQALGLGQDQLMGLIDSTIGGWAKYGDSIPIDSLAEAINETVKAGQVTGTFADILNWGAKEGETYGVAMKAATEENEAWNQSVADAETAEDFFNLALQECATEAERINLVMQAMADQGLAAAGEKWKENNASMVESNQVNADLQAQMALLGEKIEPIATRLTELVVAVLEWFNGLDAGTQNFILATVGIIAALGPVGSAIGGVSGIIEKLSAEKLPGLSSAFETITGKVLPGVQSAFTSVFGFIAANPVVLLIAAIVGLVALIATKGDEIQAGLQKVDDFLQDIFAKDWTEVFGPVLGGILNDFFAQLKDYWDAIKKIFDGVIDFIRGVFTGDWERAWKGVVGIFQGIFDGLATILKTPINAVIKLINGAIDGINWLIEGVNKIPGVSIGTIGQIPLLANGGEVLRGSAIVGEAGPELLTVLDDRTVVQPLSGNTTNTTNHLGGVTIVVYGAPGQNVRELAHVVLDEIQGIYDSEEAALV